MSHHPTISVIIPTYRRPELLKRAVQSVVLQTFQDWELLISDDEDPPGPAWEWLQNLGIRDPRIIPFRNTGKHGQCGNMNSLLQSARGKWIKPLYDDDVMLPCCLQVMLKAVEAAESVSIASCRMRRFEDGMEVKRVNLGQRPLLELVHSPDAIRGALLLDDVSAGIPTQVMVHRTCIEKGALFEDHPQLYSGVDAAWNLKFYQMGDLLSINLKLVEEHQGVAPTVTSQISQDDLDREYEVLQDIYRTALPNPASVNQTALRHMLYLVRSMNRLSRHMPKQALLLAARAWHVLGWYYAIKWLLRRFFPGKFYAVPRIALCVPGLLDDIPATELARLRHTYPEYE